LLAAAAQLSLARGRFEQAACLIAAAQTLRAQSGTLLPAEQERDELALLASLRAQLGTVELERLLMAGRELDSGQAVAVGEALLSPSG
jgi:hypothetical protein